ncbi:MAG: hypothetical protein A2V81_00425 [Candidatus Abawacabacteria bacterium RBG_16_42_10]|uniref:DNA recombination protein RmuC n=1 Tax=Candidatus Abawacabacteria bacterium RBG_16_42_10 TaxID=1817814 RepID=A0A1F4XJD4_9BACT|nr:MAG: hypothetical protein A2V81_00425 [Candidatus Abawacabacteria bacterium RBG_16_42_10]
MELILIVILVIAVFYLIYQNSRFGRSVQDDMKTTVNWTSDQIRTSNSLIGAVTEKLTTIEESQKQVLLLTNQMRELEMIFKNPKKRGIIGEIMLEEQLAEVLPKTSYKMQHRFKDGMVVDAAIKVRDMIVPVDAKFPLENFEKEGREKEFIRDVKLRIDETSKYVREAEHTSGFAFMYIPAEGIMSTLLHHDIVQYAFAQKVILVSPLSFFAYLQTVIQGLNALKIEEKTKDILSHLAKMKVQVQNWQVSFEKVVKYIDFAKQATEDANKDAEKLKGTIEKTLN